MLLAAICDDEPGALALRRATRGAYLDNLEPTGVVAPFPYAVRFALAGLFGQVDLCAWNRVLG